MKKRIITSIILSLFIFTSCMEETFFGKSEYANIKNIELTNQAAMRIDESNKTITIEMPAGVDISAVSIKLLELSTFATADKKIGDFLDMSNEATINVTSESGKTVTWKLIPAIATSEPQLANSNFNFWYKTADGYYEPGEAATSTIWGTGNPGTHMLKLYAATPFELASQNYGVKLQTPDNGKLSAVVGLPISAGSIYTGKFDPNKIDPANPQKAIDFGTLFVGRAASFTIKYTYKPGTTNKDKKGNVLSYPDACDIYAYLEIRQGGKIERLATAWFRSSETVETVKTITVKFNYGKLDSSFPDYMKPENGLYVTGDSVSYALPSHITFVASSSYDGAKFAGAIGSTLMVDDLEINY